MVSAQNRQRFYAHSIPNVEQPEDRGVLLKDILESGYVDKEKSYCLKHQAGNTRDYFKKHHTQVAFEPVCIAQRGRLKDDTWQQKYEARTDGKSNTLTKVQKDNLVAEPIRLGDIGSTSQAHRVYSPEGKSVNLVANGGGQGAKTGLYFVPLQEHLVKLACDKGQVYEVRGSFIETKFGVHKINLPDGYYIIRKLTVSECCRLQTMPDNYMRAVSDTQAYKGLGNGWTAEVIIHILKHMNIPLDEEIIVLSMYDGIATGRYCFDKMGYKNIKYHAYEIDKYAMQVANSNYSDITQYGDAFKVRENDWSIDCNQTIL